MYGCGENSAASFATEGAFSTQLCDPSHPGLDYGNTAFSHRNRFLATFLYELPFGKGQAFLNNNGLLDRVVGGWELSGVALFQTGPFLTVSTLNDPSGTGFNSFTAVGGRADTVKGVSPYTRQSLNQWVNPGRLVDPPSDRRPGSATLRMAPSSVPARKPFRFRCSSGFQLTNGFGRKLECKSPTPLIIRTTILRATLPLPIQRSGR